MMWAGKYKGPPAYFTAIKKEVFAIIGFAARVKQSAAPVLSHTECRRNPLGTIFWRTRRAATVHCWHGHWLGNHPCYELGTIT